MPSPGSQGDPTSPASGRGEETTRELTCTKSRSSGWISVYLFDYSPDMEYLEIVSPADFKTVDMPPATDKVPPVTPWK